MIIITIFFPSCLIAQENVEQARDDGNLLIEMYRKYIYKLQDIYGITLFWSTDVKDAESALASLESVEKDVLPTLKPFLSDFADKYGTDSVSISNKFFALGLKDNFDQDVGDKFRELTSALENIKKSRKATAYHIITQANMIVSDINFFKESTRLDKLREAKSLLQIGQKFDSSNSDIKKLLVIVDKKINELSR